MDYAHLDYAHRIANTIRLWSRACSVALAALLAEIAACGAALPPGL